MKQIKQFFLALFILSALASCKQSEKGTTSIHTIDQESTEAINPYFTRDQDDNAVLCWTAKDSSGTYQLKYAIYNNSKNTFNEPITVSSSNNLSTSAESMGKVAFKADGSVIAIYGKKLESTQSPYASAVYYSASTDQGKNWSSEKIIHSDTSTNVGHSYFDIARLKDGELAAIWLDGRFGKTEKGLALFFAKTQGGSEFGRDTLLDKSTCECCRTELLCDVNGDIHIAYRDISYPNGVFGKQVRDMVYLASSDDGKSFSQPASISFDNWEVDGCPHTGPSLAVDKQQIHAVWFTAGGSTGLYHTSSAEIKGSFNVRNLISSTGKHPQMTALADHQIAIVFEDVANETNLEKSDQPKKEDHHEMQMNHDHSNAGNSKIVLYLKNEGSKAQTINITDGKTPAHHAVVHSLSDNSVLISWVHEENGKASINYSKYTL